MVHSSPEHSSRTRLPDPAPLRRARLSGSVRLPPGCEAALFLFTPRGEKLWADGWDPQFPAPADDDTEPGTVFETAHGPQRTTWVVCAREPGRSVRYARVVHGQNAGTVTVTLDDAGSPGHGGIRPHGAVRRGRRRPGPVRRPLSQYLQHWEEAIADATSTPDPPRPPAARPAEIPAAGDHLARGSAQNSVFEPFDLARPLA